MQLNFKWVGFTMIKATVIKMMLNVCGRWRRTTILEGCCVLDTQLWFKKHFAKQNALAYLCCWALKSRNYPSSIFQLNWYHLKRHGNHHFNTSNAVLQISIFPHWYRTSLPWAGMADSLKPISNQTTFNLESMTQEASPIKMSIIWILRGRVKFNPTRLEKFNVTASLAKA